MRKLKKIVVAVGTRPEIIKVAPVVEALRLRPENFDVVVVATGQHVELAEDAFGAFDFGADVLLNAMNPDSSLGATFARMISLMDEELERLQPDLLLVHGDTASTLATSIAGHFREIPIGHIEAGLRSGDIWAPWPEEFNRKAVDAAASLHFAPTENARRNLEKEGHFQSVSVTGNTVIDSLFRIRDKHIEAGLEPVKDRALPIVVATQHRRENHGASLDSILGALSDIAGEGVRVIFPQHPNPEVARSIDRLNQSYAHRLEIVPPLSYVDMVALLMSASLIVTDSGGLQEEGPALGIPVLVTRDVTERPEAIECGAAELVGSNRQVIVDKALRLLEFGTDYEKMASAGSPFGDGHAGERIAASCSEFLREGKPDNN